MLNKDMQKSEIDKAIAGKTTYMQIYELNRLLKQDVPYDTKKFVYMRLAEAYEKNKMFYDAARCFETLAMIAIPFSEKIVYHTKEVEYFVKAGDFKAAETAMRKAMNDARPIEKNNIYLTVKEFYKKQASAYEKSDMRNNALKVYEHLFHMDLTQQEKKEVKEKLLFLYQKLGKFREYDMLKGME